MSTKRTFTQRLAGTYILIIFFALALSFAGFYSMLTRRTANEIDNTINSYALQLSRSSNVEDALLAGSINQEFSDYLDQIIDDEQYVDYIVICNPESIRLFHPDKSLIGERFQGGDEGPVLTGETYITNGKGTREYQRRCFAPVRDDASNLIGFVMVSCYTKSITAIYTTELIRFVGLFILSLLVGIVFSNIIAGRLRKVLLGYEPAHIAEMFTQREDILNTLNEGLVLLDGSGEVAYMNKAAEQLMGVEEAYSKDDIKGIIQSLGITDNGNTSQKQVSRNDKDILVSVGPMFHEDKQIGKLVLLDDMTRLNRTAEELTGVKHIVEALRTTTHEQKNRLHVILGLLQLGDSEEAMHYITDSISSDENSNAILNNIKDKTIAALILGKINRANELGIDMQLVKDSYLEEDNPYLTSHDLVTIIGNLVENSFDALSEKSDNKKVELFVRCSEEGLIIIVDDTGPGMIEEVKEKIMKESYSSKGENRGTGLTLIRNIVERSHGSISVDTELGEGSSFTVMVNNKRKGFEKEA